MTVGQVSSLLSIRLSTCAFQIQPIRRIDKAAKPPGQPFALPCFLVIVWRMNKVYSERTINWLLCRDEQLSKVLKFRVFSAWRSPPLFHSHRVPSTVLCFFLKRFAGAQRGREQDSRSHSSTLVRIKKREN